MLWAFVVADASAGPAVSPGFSIANNDSIPPHATTMWFIFQEYWHTMQAFQLLWNSPFF